MKAANYTESSAVFSAPPRGARSLYRYELRRRWAEGPMALWIGAKAHNAPARLLTAQRNVALLALVQVGLGIVTLLLAVPVAVAALHQLVAVAMLGAAVLAAHAARR